MESFNRNQDKAQANIEALSFDSRMDYTFFESTDINERY